MAEEQTQQQMQTTQTNGTDGTNETNETNAKAPATERTLTQGEVNAIIAREKAAWKRAAEEERRKAEMTEAERLKAEKAEAEAKATESAKAAGARIVRTEARAALADAGVKAERRDYALRMLDLSAVDVDDSGDVDGKAIADAVGKLLADIPELKSGAGAAAGGSEMNGGAGSVDLANVDMDTFAKQWRDKNKRT